MYRLALRDRPLNRFPPLSRFPGHSPAQLAKCRESVKELRSEQTSEMIVNEDLR